MASGQRKKVLKNDGGRRTVASRGKREGAENKKRVGASKPKRKLSAQPLNIVAVIVVITFFVLVATYTIGRLYRIQIVYGEDYYRQSQNRLKGFTEKEFRRGNIYYVNSSREDGDTELISSASFIDKYNIVADPELIDNPADALDDLSEIIDTSGDRDFLIKRLSRENDRYEIIRKDVGEGVAERVADAGIRGIFVEKYKQRYYPAGFYGAKNIGFISYVDNKLRGAYGLESFYEKVLSGNIKSAPSAGSLLGAGLPNGSWKKETMSIVTGIESKIQTFLYNTIVGVNEKWNSEETGAIVLDLKNGGVIAMDVVPEFDLNNFADYSVGIFGNQLVQNVYEFGSVMKPLIVAIGIDSGNVSRDFKYHDIGYVKVKNREIYNFDKKGRGDVGIKDILSQSLNTGMVAIMSDIPSDTLVKYMERVGITEKTGIDLPGEASPLTSNLYSGREVEMANISFGQGIALSPIGMARALASVATGRFAEPVMVKSIYREEVKKSVPLVDDGGFRNTLYKKIFYDGENGGEANKRTDMGLPVFKDETVRFITDNLVYTYEHSINKNGKISPFLESYDIAAKTGTAQIANPEEGGYFKDRYLHSMFGYFPAYDPRFLVFIYTYNPKGVQYSSQSLSEPFSDIIEDIINYYDIPPRDVEN